MATTDELLAAAEAGDLQRVRQLVEAGASVNCASLRNRTPLAAAASKARLGVVQFLIERGADIFAADSDDQTPLAYAAQSGDVGVVRFLIDRGAGVDGDQDCGWTPVMTAAVHRHVDVVNYLVECGADVNKPDHAGQTPLLWAALNGFLDVVQCLVGNGADVNATDSDGDTPLIIAATEGHLEIVRYLVSCGADMKATECDGWTPTARAADRGHLEVVRYLVDCGGDANAPNSCGFTALMSAASHGRLDVMQYLHERGGDLNVADSNGRTALSYAAAGASLEIVQFLVDRGADVNEAVDAYQQTPLMQAAMFGHADIVRYLADRGGEGNVRDCDRQTPLTGAAARGRLETVRFLINAGAQVNAVGEKGRTSAICAAMGGHLGTIQCIISHGADPNAADDEGRTAMIWAAIRGHLDVMRYLEDHGATTNWDSADAQTSIVLAAANGHADVIEHLIALGTGTKARDSDGRTMLTAAATNGHLDTVKLLIGHDADADMPDNDARTPLWWASTRGHLDIARYLLNHGADVNAADNAGMTSLMCASQGGETDAALLFIECGAYVNTADHGGWTPLMFAAQRGDSHLVRKLIECGARVGDANKEEKTGLTYAASEGHLDAVQALVSFGADVNAVDDGGVTPLICAVKGGHLNCVRYLIACGADPNMATHGGDSAIFFSAKYDFQDIHRLLLRHVGRSRADAARMEPDSSLPTKPAPWRISPFDVELLQYVETGNVGGHYRATWLDTEVAVKIFTHGSSDSSFAALASRWHQLRHPNVIKLYGACDTGHVFFVCEYASHGTVADYLNACRPDGWTPLRYLHQAALGLAYLHERKIVHGNVRGSKLLVGSDGQAKLTEFGWSGLAAQAQASASMQRMAGSTNWQAPERVRGGPATFASDIYSLGMCIIEIVTGKVPWGKRGGGGKGEWDPASNDRIMEVLGPASFPWYLRDVIRRTCSRDAASRATASSVAKMLERLAAQEEARKSYLEPEPGPDGDFTTFKGGETKRLWDFIERLMQAATVKAQPQQRVFQELKALTGRLKQASQPQKTFQRYHDLLADFHCTLQVGPQANRVLRLSSTRAIGDSILAYQYRIRDLCALLGEGSKDAVVQLEPQAFEQSTNHLEVFVSEISKTWLVLNELETDEDRQTFLTLLKSEIEVHPGSYTNGQLETMQQAFDDVSHATGVLVETATPAWFLPWYELSEWKWLTEGGFGSVYRAKWLESEVLVKQMKQAGAEKSDKCVGASSPWNSIGSFSTTRVTAATTAEDTSKREQARSMFQREVGIWFHLSHPHIVRLFGACHVGNPLFVCEYAAHGSLDKYLREHPEQIWRTLHEAALGVQYLHACGVVHGDLKCNNIVVGSDWKAKVTDFGLSSATFSADDEADSSFVTGAWHWVAPECLVGDSRAPTFASDVFALGMCIVEALRIVEAARLDKSSTSRYLPPLPWGSLGNAEVKYHVTRGELPLRPRECTDAQWSLVNVMCRFQPYDRIKMCTVVDELAILASDGGDERKTDEAAISDSMETMQSFRDDISTMQQLNRHQDDESGASESRSVAQRVHGLLWERFAHIADRLDGEKVKVTAFSTLIKRAKTSTMEAGSRMNTLTQVTEMALHGYALHRQLDKFMAANFVKIDGDHGGCGVHAWQEKCYGFLGVEADEEAPECGHAVALCT